MTTERLHFDDLAPHLLLKNGNFLYKVPFRDGFAVLKVYYGSRGTFGRLKKSLANYMAGQTTYMPKTRCRVERETLNLWRSHGFRTFDVLDVEVDAPTCVPGGYLMLEYVSAPLLVNIMKDETRSADERIALWRRFLPEWGRRHELAIELREPRLVHENGDCKHVMVMEDELLWFDLEMVYRHANKVELHVAHEIAQFLWQLLKKLTPEMQERVLEETVKHYPSKARLQSAYDFFYRHPNPAMRFGRALERKYRAKAQKPTSKYHVVKRLAERL